MLWIALTILALAVLLDELKEGNPTLDSFAYSIDKLHLSASDKILWEKDKDISKLERKIDYLTFYLIHKIKFK